MMMGYDSFHSLIEHVLLERNQNSLELLKLFLKNLAEKSVPTLASRTEMHLRRDAPLVQSLSVGNSETSRIAQQIHPLLKIRLPAPPVVIDADVVVACRCGCKELTKCKYQEEIFLGTEFAVPPNLVDSSSEALGLFGRVTGGMGVLVVNRVLENGCWACTIRFVQSKGQCQVGIAAVTKEFPFGDFSDESDGNLTYDNMGNYKRSGGSSHSSKQGWTKDARVTVEIDMDERRVCFFVNSVLQKVAYTDIPELVRVYTWNLHPSLVHLVRFAPLPKSTTLTPQMNVKEIPWD